MDTLSLALAQINPVVGDIEGNVGRILLARAEMADGGAELVVFPELSVCGYSPEDLVLRPSFLNAVDAAIEQLAAATADGGPAMLVGAPLRVEESLYNAALLLDGGKVVAHCFKHELPNYGVFDEMRVFTPGVLSGPIEFRGLRLGIMICEDMWEPTVARHLSEAEAEILIVLNASPFETGKRETRRHLAEMRVDETGLPLVCINQIGGQDELVFDGASFILGPDGALRGQTISFGEHLSLTNWRRGETGWDCDACEMAADLSEFNAVYSALVLGLRDYVAKNGFLGILIGLSGGIDSALSAAIAVDALGADRVHCVMMPSPYTSRSSLDDAAAVATGLGVRLDTISIQPAMTAFDDMMKEIFVEHAIDTTEENIQARSRGITLMALSNKFGFMVLSTGNKSEMSVGYATLYGDMCGGFSVLKDVYKTDVYALSRWRNEHRPEGGLGPGGPGGGVVIPEHVLIRPPSAELKPNQTDQDSLPPYDELDDILKSLIEEDMSLQKIIEGGHDEAIVKKVWRMVQGAEYKRRQAPPGVRVSRRAFGRDRRYPITNHFRGPS